MALPSKSVPENLPDTALVVLRPRVKVSVEFGFGFTGLLTVDPLANRIAIVDLTHFQRPTISSGEKLPLAAFVALAGFETGFATAIDTP